MRIGLRVAVGVLQCVAVCCSVLQCSSCSVCVAECCKDTPAAHHVEDPAQHSSPAESVCVLQCVAECCRVLQCVANTHTCAPSTKRPSPPQLTGIIRTLFSAFPASVCSGRKRPGAAALAENTCCCISGWSGEGRGCMHIQ
jgi:hypothetical protein